ncbi:MAG: DEAD/DEAH box helicase [Candidatus Firestonebacteria bacterium]
MIKKFIEHLSKNTEHAKSLIHIHYIPSKKGEYSPFPSCLSEPLINYLKKNNINQLYSHQLKALDLIINEKKNVLTVTPTASGKTLIYNLPVIDSCLRDNKTKALYIYPLKALTHDQFKTLMEFKKELFDKDCFLASIYDGDTSSYERQKIRKNCPDIIMTNPDMLHLGILPYHSNWKEFFKNLKFVVIDEVHSYRGVFGSHVGHIIRRLRRICKYYGSDPLFIASSATILNPKEFVFNLTGLDFSVINESGAPTSSKYFLLWNSCDSPYLDAAHLLKECIDNNMKTIVFTKARKVTELIYQRISALGGKYHKKINAYRAGYLPEERREIEKKLFNNELLGVISTSALEVGIDIGGLDVCLLVGYPGSMMSTWQRGGRVGRTNEAVVILLALQDALDQYFITHPAKFFGKDFETAVIDVHNNIIANAQLSCSAFELPLDENDKDIYGESLISSLEFLVKDGKLQKSIENKYFSFIRHPERNVSIRSIGDSFLIIDEKSTIGEIDYPRVLNECHPKAIYLHSGIQYEVKELDLINKKVRVREVDVDYYTEPRTAEKVEVLDVSRQKKQGEVLLKLGKVKITEKVIGYVRKNIYTQVFFDEGILELTLPPNVFETVSIWFEIPKSIKEIIESGAGDFQGGIHAIEHSMISIFPLFALCDRMDLGGVSYDFYDQSGVPTIFIYDAHRGGVGLSEKAYQTIDELIKATLNLIKDCPCEFGCPSCVQSPKCGNGNKPLDKNVAIDLLQRFLIKKGFKEKEKIFLKKQPENDIGGDMVDKLNSMNILVFDLETQRSADEVGGWNNKHLMKMAVGVIYSTKDKQFKSYTEDKIKDMFDEFLKADLIVGFNIKNFDWNVLSYYTNIDFTKLPTLDILELVHKRLGFRLSLDHLALANLKKSKIADGLQSLQWFKEGKINEIIEYCQQDVVLTKELFEFMVKNKYLLYASKDGRILQIPIDVNEFLEGLI